MRKAELEKYIEEKINDNARIILKEECFMTALH